MFRSLRQFRVTEHSTGHRTYVMGPYDGGVTGGSVHKHAAVLAGFSVADYYAHRVRVDLVNEGFERPLAFDGIAKNLGAYAVRKEVRAL